MNATRHNNNVYKTIVQKLTLENQTTSERYLKTLEKAKALESEIVSLKTQNNAFPKSIDPTKPLRTEIESLKSALHTQIGEVTLISLNLPKLTNLFISNLIQVKKRLIH